MKARSRGWRCLAWRLGWVVLGGAGPARGQVGLEGFEVDQAFFVPERGHAWTFGVALEGRFAGLAGQEDQPWPTRGLRLDLGWLHYFEGHGQVAAGPYLGYGRSLPDALNPDAAFQHLAVGGLIRLRPVNERFFTLSFGLFGEVGPFFAEARPSLEPTRPPEGTGLRSAAGAELFGLGALVYLSPWVFAEVVPWLGVEVISVGREDVSLGGGVRLRLDFTGR